MNPIKELTQHARRALRYAQEAAATIEHIATHLASVESILQRELHRARCAVGTLVVQGALEEGIDSERRLVTAREMRLEPGQSQTLIIQLERTIHEPRVFLLAQYPSLMVITGMQHGEFCVLHGTIEAIPPNTEIELGAPLKPQQKLLVTVSHIGTEAEE